MGCKGIPLAAEMECTGKEYAWKIMSLEGKWAVYRGREKPGIEARKNSHYDWGRGKK